jgi:alkanesulfonate monooxygenase SsuD/methylene tetrahydromethanopterin reductase-like flavin-dependent oxidoreductase (luciferase family)
MKFSFAMPNSVRVKALTQPFELDVTGADQVVMAKRAEELGYDMIPIPEHFVVPTAHVELSGPHYFHSTVAQAFIAGATQRIRVNSTVTLLPLQHPVIMAKALSTADWMSGGRITVTFRRRLGRRGIQDSRRSISRARTYGRRIPRRHRRTVD